VNLVENMQQDKEVYKVTSVYQLLNNMPSSQLYGLLQSPQKNQAQLAFHVLAFCV
jgi:hypothetical protein